MKFKSRLGMPVREEELFFMATKCAAKRKDEE